jgi:hypothetical protein
MIEKGLGLVFFFGGLCGGNRERMRPARRVLAQPRKTSRAPGSFPLSFKRPYPVLLLCGGLRGGIRGRLHYRAEGSACDGRIQPSRMYVFSRMYGLVWHLQHRHTA